MTKNSFLQEEDNGLEITRTRFANVLKRHGELTERLSRDSDKMIFERLQKEFEVARASQTQEISLDGEQWNDGLLATIRERVHMEAERKAMQLSGDSLPFHDKITYKVANKVICCLEGARIGIQYETSFAGEPCEFFHCVLESKSFLEKMTVLEHTVPFFLPIREAENEFLSSNAMKFIDYVGDLLQAYVDRREQFKSLCGEFEVSVEMSNFKKWWTRKLDNSVRIIKELYGNQIKELYHSLPYHMVEFVLDDYDCKVTVSLRYADLVSILPSGVSVLAWPMQRNYSRITTTMGRRGSGSLESKTVPERLSYAEDALRTMSLPEAYAEVVLNLSKALQEVFPQRSSA